MPSTYWFSALAGAQQPYLYLAPTVGGKPAVAIGLDEVFLTPQRGTLPASPPFALVAGTEPFAYQITADSSVWTFDRSPIRPAIRAGFDGFLQALDAKGLKGGRLHQIRGWLAQTLPQTFAESLYFRYGLDPQQRCVELSPGMRLRIDFQSHQSVDPGVSALNGFVSSGRTWVEIGQLPGSQGGLVLGFDPFLSQLQGFTVSPSTAGSGGPVDLQGAAYQMPYWRLYYPAVYPSSDGSGFAAAAQNPVLVGAPTRDVLETAGRQYLSDGTVPSPAVGVWFRGRTTVVPEIPILLQNELRHVTLGCTLRGLFAAFMPLPWLPGNVPSQFMFRLSTPLTAAGPNLKYGPLGPYVLVGLNSTYAVYSDTLDSFDLPLVGGDSITIPATG
ncbi:MAG: hypothetical protein ACRDOB_04755 [Streptosporangiaceae bacterium]